MKCKVLFVKKLPDSYKQCNIANALHLKFEKEDEFIEQSDSALRKKYLTFMKERICEEIKNANMIARADVVKVNNEYFVIFKSNLDKRLLQTLLRNLLLEFNEYTQGTLDLSYAIQDLMIMQEGKDPTILGSFKMGDDYLKTYTKEKFKQVDVSGTKSRTKYFPSFEEYKKENETKGYDYYI